MGVDKEKFDEIDAQTLSGFYVPLTVSQQIWFALILPTAACCAIYIADIATDIALVERHLSDQRPIFGAITLVLIYAPAVVFFILTLLNEEKWPDPEEGTLKKTLWVAKQVALLLVFPIHAIHRFAGKLFWSLEALLCSDEEQKEALEQAFKTSYAELYLLLQAFFQAAPQAVLQTYILTTFKIPHERTGTIQVLGIMTSIASAAISAAVYMRFESQRVLGRVTPWSAYKPSSPEKKGLEPKESLMTTIESQMTSDTADVSPTDNKDDDRSESPKPSSLPKGVPQTAILSLPPLPPQIRARLLKASGEEIPDELKKDLESSVADGEPLNIRSSIYGVNLKSQGKDNSSTDISSLDFTLPPILSAADLPPAPPPPPPPRTPSPNPGCPPPPPPIPIDIPMDDNEDAPPSISEEPADEADEPISPEHAQLAMAESTEAVDETANPSTDQSPTVELRIEEHLSSEPLLEQSTATLEVKPITPINTYPLPTRKRTIEGLGEDEIMGKFIAFTWWFLFITSRVLALSILAFFFPWGFAAVVLLHYLAMVSYLFYCEKSDKPSTTLLRLGLGFVYLICFIEVRTRFKHPKNFTVAFITLGAVENIITGGGWFFLGKWTSWWFLYSFYFIIITLFLSFLAMGMYLIMLKPHTKSVDKN